MDENLNNTLRANLHHYSEIVLSGTSSAASVIIIGYCSLSLPSQKSLEFRLFVYPHQEAYLLCTIPWKRIRLSRTMATLNTNSLIQWPGWPTILCFSVLSSLIVLFTSSRKREKSTSPSAIGSEDVEPTCYPQIESLTEFCWETKEPVNIRPFKPKYNLTMSKWPKKNSS